MTPERSTNRLPEETARKIAEYNQRIKKLKLSQVNRARALEKQIDAEVVGVWGHLTNVGAKEYAVYKKNGENSHFVILGYKEEFERYDVPEEIRKRAQRLVIGPRESIGQFEIKSINPERTPNGLPIRSIEEFLT